MRPELQRIELIEKYLNREMDPGELRAFEEQMATDPALKEQVELQFSVMRAVERSSLKEKIAVAKKNFHFGKKFMKWGFGGFVAVAIVGLVLLYNNSITRSSYHHKSLPKYNEQGEKLWADADRNIAAQTFSIDASKDTVIETTGGIVLAIPANSFLDGNRKPVSGKVDLVLKEALDPSTMMEGGLSTKSGNDLLESGGMFFIDARKNDQPLKIDSLKGIHAEIPTNEVKPGMQLFSGKRLTDGTIDWEAPKPLTHDLVPVAINTLNFYPPDYLDSLAFWGHDINNKPFTDSLYYSFASLFFKKPPSIDTTVKVREMDMTEHPADSSFGDAWPLQGSKPTFDRSGSLNGEMLFQTKCAACHSPSRPVTGPALRGILYNDYYQGDIKKIHQWVTNVNSMINTVPHYKVLKAAYGSSMTQFNLTEQQVAAIFDYVENVQDCGINPAKIKAIWNEQFQNTLISTREFEERLKWIHIEGNPEILDLYVNSLDKPLYYIDSMAASKVHVGLDSYNIFESFAARRDGSVKNGSTQFEILKRYYQNKAKAYTEAISKTQNEFWQKQQEMDINAANQKNEHQLDSTNREAENFQQEFDLNLQDAYRQLGYKIEQLRPAPTVYSVQITNPGWYNVDKYVLESTAARTTLNYTDPQSGKKAIINYEPLSVEVHEWKAYDRFYVYLLPDKLNSFIRLSGTEGQYSEKLNELIKYDMVCIGYKDDQAFYYEQKNIHAKEYKDPGLVPITSDDLNFRLNSFRNQSSVEEIKKEQGYFQFEVNDLKRQRTNISSKELTTKLRPVIFPCFLSGTDQTYELTDITAPKK